MPQCGGSMTRRGDVAPDLVRGITSRGMTSPARSPNHQRTMANLWTTTSTSTWRDALARYEDVVARQGVARLAGGRARRDVDAGDDRARVVGGGGRKSGGGVTRSRHGAWVVSPTIRADLM